MSYQKILESAVCTFGEKEQKKMAIEEMAELTQAICKDERGKLDRKNMLEEIVDVSIMLEQLVIIYGFKGNEIYEKKQAKLSRLGNMVEEEKEKQKKQLQEERKL